MTAVASRQLPLFRRLSRQGARRLLAAAVPERYARGDVLFRQGDPAEAIWVVQEGWIHLLRMADEAEASRAVTIFTITPAEVLCGLSAVTRGAVYQVCAVAGTACRVLRLPAPLFRDALAREAPFAAEVVHLCVRRLQHVASQYGAMAEPVSQRVIRALLRLSSQFGPTIPVTHRELAQMAWTTTESAIRTIRKFKAQGYITGSRGRLTMNRRELAQLLDGAGESRALQARARSGGAGDGCC